MESLVVQFVVGAFGPIRGGIIVRAGIRLETRGFRLINGQRYGKMKGGGLSPAYSKGSLIRPVAR